MRQKNFKKSPTVKPDTIQVGKIYLANGKVFKVVKRVPIKGKDR